MCVHLLFIHTKRRHIDSSHAIPVTHAEREPVMLVPRCAVSSKLLNINLA